ncbi:MAG: hypothetical protein ACYS7M_11755, partial [Planctomycetota bacterium]
LDEALLRQVQRHKRAVTRCVAAGVLPLVITVALGADVMNAPSHSTYHLAAALLALAANAIALGVQFRHIRLNQTLVDAVMTEYRISGPTPTGAGAPPSSVQTSKPR